eukprot:TRINITY_DN30959_c0_g1_i1.p1 TRINITY_DN30959_c0_g1~~TRINITY_DN30959_c0_g1_i1.p1  ORF type:complete len:211 (+),score=64.40 TRINITY_DN30959_c0_g1_i1:1-633(+)
MHSAALNNWHAVCAIFTSFSLISEKILMEWKQKTESNLQKFYKAHQDLFTPMGKQHLVDLLKDLASPCIPVIGPFRSAIALVNNEFPQDRFTDEIINTQKMKKLGEIFLKLRRLQQHVHNFTPLHVIRDYLRRPREVRKLVKSVVVTNSKTSTLDGVGGVLLDVMLRDMVFKWKVRCLLDHVMEGENNSTGYLELELPPPPPPPLISVEP